jgi:hypothetical protein
MADALVAREGLLTFAHDFLRTAARNVYLPTASQQRQAHIRLAEYFESQPVGPRQTDEMLWQLAQASDWKRLHDLLTDHIFFSEALGSRKGEIGAAPHAGRTGIGPRHHPQRPLHRPRCGKRHV